MDRFPNWSTKNIILATMMFVRIAKSFSGQCLLFLLCLLTPFNVILVSGYQTLSSSSSFTSYLNGRIMSSSYQQSNQYSSTPITASVHRYSSLYGTILHCQDYLTLASNSFNNHHNNDPTGRSIHSHHHLIDHHNSGINTRLRDLQTIFDMTYRHQQQQQQQQQYSNNITFEWQVRVMSSLSGAAKSDSSSSSSSSSINHYNSNNQQYQRAYDHSNLRYTNIYDGTLALAPFESDSFAKDVHDAYYRCLLIMPQGIIAGREIHLQAVVERFPAAVVPTSLSGSSSSTPEANTSAKGRLEPNIRIRIHNSSETLEGNDAILKCELERRIATLYEVVAWYRDDGRIYLPLEQLVQSIRRSLGGTSASNDNGHSSLSLSTAHYVNYSTIRHFVLPGTGDLLISSVNNRDAKHRYRCQIRHQITNHRQFSQSWAYILFKKSADYYNSGPRLNPQIQIRHTVAVNEGEAAFFYCSFDGYPTPTVEWYHNGLKNLDHLQSSSFSSPTYLYGSFEGSHSNDNEEKRLRQSPKPISWLQKSNTANDQYSYGKNFLIIEKVSLEDTGIISCVANNSNSIIRHEMLLFVKSSLQVSLQSSTLLPFPGEDITLSCNLSTASLSNSFTSAFSHLNILNQRQTKSTSTSSNVLEDLDVDNVEEQTRRHKEKYFRELISTHFMLNINWYHNGQPIEFDHRKRRSTEERLLIRDFYGPNDNGIYQCSIRLTAPDYNEEAFWAAIHIKSIEKPPEFVEIFSEQIKQTSDSKRDFLSLKCSAYGIPLPQIRWQLDGIDLYSNGHIRIETFTETYSGGNGGHGSGSSSSSSTLSVSSLAHSLLVVSYLNISSLHLKDIGIYECMAENYLGKLSHRARINQIGSPFVKPLSNQTALLGRPYTINCTYGGYPLEEVYFIKGSGYGVSQYPAKRMPFDERHLVPMLGSITISIVEKSDQDYYRCVVVTSNGQKAEQEFYLHVAVAPVISPIIFSDNFEEGKRGSAVCTVTSGDPPIQISWFKDGIPLEMTTGLRTKSHSHHLYQIQIVPINEFMSSLIISNISRHHQGTYTCMASSPVATTNQSAFLSVKAAPVWLIKPSDRNSIAGESLTLDCQTSGQPSPVIRWKFLKNEPYRNEPIPILSSQQIHVLENGSLFLRALEPKHSGIYICDASNEMSKHPIESRALITVSSLPKVSIQNTLGSSSAETLINTKTGRGSSANPSIYRGFNMDRMIMRKGSQTQLMCSVMGLEQPMIAKWIRPNGETSEQLNERTKMLIKNYYDTSKIVIREENKLNEKRAYLYISHVDRTDSGIYSCLGINMNGYSIAFTELVVQEPPDMPGQFRAQEVGSRSITLNWKLEYGGNLPITSYVIEYRAKNRYPLDTSDHFANDDLKNSGGVPSPSTTTAGSAVLTAKSLTNAIIINGLNPLTTYEFRVCALNELGASPFTEPLLITTEIEAPSLIPVDLRTLVLGSRSIKLIWSIVLTVEPPIEQIDGFYIGYRPLLSLGGLTAAGPVSATGTNSNSKNNNSGDGSGSINSSANGIMLIGSSLNVQTGNGAGEKQQSGGQTKHSVNVITDNNGASAGIENNKGTIPYTFKTMYDDPNSKLALLMSTAAINNNGSSLSNKSETKQADSGNNTNNNNMTSYCELINRNEKDLMDSIQTDSISKNKFQSNKQQWNTAGYGYQRVSATKLTNNKMQIRCNYEFVLNLLHRQTRYGFIIQAFNSKGAGPISPEVYAQTLLKDPPGKPSIKLANVSLYEASFIWTMPMIEIANEITTDFESLESMSNSINIDGFIISYRPLVKRASMLYSSLGTDDYDIDDHVDDDDLDSDFGSRSYERKYQANNWETISVSEKLQGHTLQNLRCGTLYQIRVEAFNEMGSGEPSDVLQFSTLGQAPTVPNSNAFIMANITSVMLDLDRWNNGLCPIVNFALRYRVKESSDLSGNTGGIRNGLNNNNNNWITVSTHLKPEFGAMYVIRELIPATWYELSIVASNDAGETESRYLFSTLTVNGATVEPLFASDYNRRHLEVVGGVGATDSIFEDPMILIPATCAILVLLVIGAATVFIFITRSKEALSRTEHFCRHRENSRSDQLSLNMFSKNYFKSAEMMRSYNNNETDANKLTQIETLNCGQTADLMNGNCVIASGVAANDGMPTVGMISSQYVEGATTLSYTVNNDNDPSSLPPIMDTTTPSRHIKQNKLLQESFYSTPCIASQTLVNTIPQVQDERSGQIDINGQILCCNQKFNKITKQVKTEFCPEKSIYSDLPTTSGKQSIVIPTSSPQQGQHSYYTHSQFLNQDSVDNNSSISTQFSSSASLGKKIRSDKNHIYELPKQQIGQESKSQKSNFEPENFIMLMMHRQPQTQNISSGTMQSSNQKNRSENSGKFHSFYKNF